MVKKGYKIESVSGDDLFNFSLEFSILHTQMNGKNNGASLNAKISTKRE